MGWWVAKLHGGQTRMALILLEQRGYVIYFPQMMNGRKRPEALFPNYAFLAVAQTWSSARFCPGVIRLVGPPNSAPTLVADEVIQAIREREEGGGLVRLPKAPTPRRLARGARIRVAQGAFAG
jgi:transcription antitermination factor NusG